MKVSNIFFINIQKKREKTYETLKNRITDQKLTAKMKIILAMSGKLSQFQFGFVN